MGRGEGDMGRPSPSDVYALGENGEGVVTTLIEPTRHCEGGQQPQHTGMHWP